MDKFTLGGWAEAAECGSDSHRHRIIRSHWRVLLLLLLFCSSFSHSFSASNSLDSRDDYAHCAAAFISWRLCIHRHTHTHSFPVQIQTHTHIRTLTLAANAMPFCVLLPPPRSPPARWYYASVSQKWNENISHLFTILFLLTLCRDRSLRLCVRPSLFR